MALPYLSGRESQSALAATQTAWTSTLVRGYKEIAIQVKYGTCTGSSNTATLKIQTSNDNANWVDLLTISSETNVSTLSGTNAFKYLPDNATAGSTGFGAYIRFHFAGSSTFSASYTIYWEAKP